MCLWCAMVVWTFKWFISEYSEKCSCIWMQVGARKRGDIKVARTPWHPWYPWHTHLILWQHSSFHNCELTEFEWNRVPDCMPWINNKKCPCPCSIGSHAANQKYQINKLHTLLITIAFQQFSGGLRYKYTMYAAHSFSFPISLHSLIMRLFIFFPLYMAIAMAKHCTQAHITSK